MKNRDGIHALDGTQMTLFEAHGSPAELSNSIFEGVQLLLPITFEDLVSKSEVIGSDCRSGVAV